MFIYGTCGHWRSDLVLELEGRFVTAVVPRVGRCVVGFLFVKNKRLLRSKPGSSHFFSRAQRPFLQAATMARTRKQITKVVCQQYGDR
ncbi:hypothetical protein NDU88_005184 [Pleurodeles waltl]|uniref:Uncharacterized protein n=1 Tax=Pleurodeles waltl TaxID=8319 RepID=A0AAV7VJ47_PLEWA|nr:hypothetical protein NDU88_005184 [Pleurodeles waltl]